MPNNVTFNDEPQYTYRASARSDKKEGSIIGLMYTLGLAKTKKDANMVLGGVIVVCLIVTATMFVFAQPRTDPNREAQLQRDFERMQTQASASSAAR
ncbi:MAG TPA: hypothetical protein VN086_01075 [Candidatus Paceibacterota bacterium]|nr:hypothetical protein [Candidatus Paceibacterota bacterium]